MMKEHRKDIRGRGASSNSASRFLSQHFEATVEDHDHYADDLDRLVMTDGLVSADELARADELVKTGLVRTTEKSIWLTELIKDSSRTIITSNDSPDVGFNYSINSYRGCEHGCAYCYARPTHEYLGYSAGLDFESKIHVKYEAPLLLRQALMKKSWQGQTLFMSGVTDCYQPIERKLKLTRGCLEVLREFKNPIGIITKNALVTRDIDILKDMAQWNGVMVFLSITTLDSELARALEPRTSTPAAKLVALEKLSEAGIKTGVNIAPVIPGLTDAEIPGILKAAKGVGAHVAGYGLLRLPGAVLPIFEEWLETHQPLKKDKVLNSIRDTRGGKLNVASFGERMRGVGVYADQINHLFKLWIRKLGFQKMEVNLNSQHFQRPPQKGDQLGFEF
ncbi:MAG: PA0069 family radical SAM protein [Bdellovibrionaceae bacterium]|nr:PA0069 family radical SAM protein [Pseudobdellovibrionaceae bacterium]